MSSTEPDGRPATRLTPEAVRESEFARTPLGRRGYLESDVARFRTGVADEIAQSDAEKAELRAELDRLRNYFREQQIEPEVNLRAVDLQAANVQAVNVMSIAQQAADQHLAQAEVYARNLVGDARRQQEAIMRQAQAQMRSLVDALGQQLERLGRPSNVLPDPESPTSASITLPSEQPSARGSDPEAQT